MVQTSGKMIFLDKFLPKMKAEGKKVIPLKSGVGFLSICQHARYSGRIYEIQ